jgi:hypothetical protein
MKILVRNSDNAVIFADDTLQLTDTHVSGSGWIAHFCTTENSRIENATLPADWVGAAYAYDGTWTVIDQAAIDANTPPPKSKAQLKAEFSTATVTTKAGNTFQANEASQTRMSRVLQAKSAKETVDWVLADNTIVNIGMKELAEALSLAVDLQTEIWTAK